MCIRDRCEGKYIVNKDNTWWQHSFFLFCIALHVRWRVSQYDDEVMVVSCSLHWVYSTPLWSQNTEAVCFVEKYFLELYWSACGLTVIPLFDCSFVSTFSYCSSVSSPSTILSFLMAALQKIHCCDHQLSLVVVSEHFWCPLCINFTVAKVHTKLTLKFHKIRQLRNCEFLLFTNHFNRFSTTSSISQTSFLDHLHHRYHFTLL